MPNPSYPRNTSTRFARSLQAIVAYSGKFTRLEHMAECATYYVSLKVLLREGDNGLFLRCGKDHWCGAPHWDWPGGRIDSTENETTITKIIKREIEEELGRDLKYTLGSLAFQFRRHLPRIDKWIFINVYEADYILGEIKLSDEHSDFEWINLKETQFDRKDFCNEEMYRELLQYLMK